MGSAGESRHVCSKRGPCRRCGRAKYEVTMDATRRQRLEAMLADEPGDAFLRYALAMELASAGDDQGALVQFDQLLNENPDYVAGYFQQGQVLARLERGEEARAVLMRGVAAARRAGDLHAAEEMAAVLATLPE